MEFDKHPPIEEYLKGLNYLNDTDFSNLQYDDIRKKYFKKAITHHSAGGHLNEKNFENSWFYRVRSEKSIASNENLNLVQTFSFPPPNFCKKGRANIEGNPVFYCTDYLEAAVKESCMVAGEIGYVSIWRLRLRRELSYSVYLPELLPKKNTWSDRAIYFNTLTSIYFAQIPPEIREHKREQQKFFINKFLLDFYPYSITSMICHSDLYSSGDVDFVVYPSAKTFQNYCNYAFHPNVAQNNLIIDRVIRFKVIDDSEYNFKISFGEVGNRKNDRIIWDYYKKNIDMTEFDTEWPRCEA